MQQLSYLNLRVVSSDAGFEQASVIPSAQDLPTSSTLYLQRKTSDDNFHSMSIAETCQLLQEMDSLLSQVPTIFLTPICTSTLQACLYLTASVLETQLMKASMARNLDSVEVSASLSSTMSATTISPTEKVPGRTQPLTRTIIDNLWRQISTVEAIRILPSGEDFMVPYEIAIQANPSRNEMNFLDLSDCPVQHQVILASYFHVRSAGAAIRHAAASLLTTLSHESTHFVQAYVDQLDLSSSPTAAFAAWSAEFDASILSYSIYLHVCVVWCMCVFSCCFSMYFFSFSIFFFHFFISCFVYSYFNIKVNHLLVSKEHHQEGMKMLMSLYQRHFLLLSLPHKSKQQ